MTKRRTGPALPVGELVAALRPGVAALVIEHDPVPRGRTRVWIGLPRSREPRSRRCPSPRGGETRPGCIRCDRPCASPGHGPGSTVVTSALAAVCANPSPAGSGSSCSLRGQSRMIPDHHEQAAPAHGRQPTTIRSPRPSGEVGVFGGFEEGIRGHAARLRRRTANGGRRTADGGS